jgi:hypothetical protein
VAGRCDVSIQQRLVLSSRAILNLDFVVVARYRNGIDMGQFCQSMNWAIAGVLSNLRFRFETNLRKYFLIRYDNDFVVSRALSDCWAATIPLFAFGAVCQLL